MLYWTHTLKRGGSVLMGKLLTADRRYYSARALAHLGWWGALAVMAAHISMGGAKPVGDAPPWLGLIIIFMIGIGIAAGNTLGRMRLSKSIAKGFDVGYDTGYRAE